MKKLERKTALITGGANGIGLGIAQRFCEDGADICIIDREAAALAEARAALEPLGTRVIAIEADCLDPERVGDAVRQALAALGHVDILVNNIGQSARERASPFVDSNEEVWRFVFDVNVFTMLRFTHLLAPAMLERGHGRIINLTSDAALIGPLKSADYAAAKAAVVGFTRAAAREFGAHDVTVNAIGPGPIKTRALERAAQSTVKEMIDNLALNFVGEPRDIAALAAHLASDDGRYITGQTMLVNGGGWFI